MHPEIKSFWEKIGEVDLTPSTPIIYYVVVSKSGCATIAQIWNGCNDDGPKQPPKYFYNNTQYSEEEMLRIIRMKTFI